MKRNCRVKDEKTVGMIARMAFVPVSSWTHKLDSEKHEEHDFCNLLSEFRYAVQRQDRMMMEYCEHELWRMYSDRRQHNGRRQSMIARHKPF